MNLEPREKVKTAIEAFLSDEGRGTLSLAGTDAVYRLEQRFASLVDLPHALAVANATLGLWAIFHALEICEAEIITTPYTWGGSLAGLLLAGNRPIFADIDSQTLTLDPLNVDRRITRNTRAILTVDIYGYPSNGPALRKVANDHGLLLIQDCAQSFGAYWDDHHTGWWADAAVFSFTWGKALFAGEGGMIVTRHRELYDQLVWSTQHPLRQSRDVPLRPPNELALNLRLNPLAAVWAEATFEYALAGVEKNRQKCLEIIQFLERGGMSRTKPPGENSRPSFHALTFEPNRDPLEIERGLHKKGWRFTVSLPPIVKPIYRQDVYVEFSRAHKWPRHERCPMSEEQCRLRRKLFPINSADQWRTSP
jgi:dTDP-4-amino-4,6-dideoxygalactose transaminase